MALEIKLKYTINDNVSQIQIEDVTGAYTINNLTGWGSPNIERDSVALVLYAKYRPFEQTPVNLSVKKALSPMALYNPAYENNAESIYDLKYYLDGWYQFYLVAVETSNNSPLENDIIYDTVLQKLQIYKQAYGFIDLSDIEWDYLTDDSKYTYGFFEEILLPNLVLQRNCQLEKYIACMECTSCKCETIKEDYSRLHALIQATDYRFHSDKQNEAQKMTEKLIKDYKCCK